MRNLFGKLFKEIDGSCNINELTEVRLRLDKEIMLKTLNGTLFLSRVADEQLLNEIVSNATNKSRYAYEEEISRGYIDYRGGIRIGIVGEGKTGINGITAISKIFALCVRIPHEILGCAVKIAELLDDFESTLLVSPPGGGKTTLLRETARLLAMRYDVLVIDERGEICGKDLCLRRGERCDVLQGVPKTNAFERAIRTMAPEIVVCDELFGDMDTEAVKKLSSAGIKVLASYHSDNDVPDAIKRIFCNRVILSSKPQPGSIVSIIRGTAAY